MPLEASDALVNNAPWQICQTLIKPRRGMGMQLWPPFTLAFLGVKPWRTFTQKHVVAPQW